MKSGQGISSVTLETRSWADEEFGCRVFPLLTVLSPGAAGATRHLRGFAAGLSRHGCSSRGDAVFWRASQTLGWMLSMSDSLLSAFPVSKRGTRQL